MSETRRPTPEDPFNQFRFIMWDKRRTYLEEINKPVDEMSDVLALKRVVQLLLPFNQDYAVIELRKLEGLPEYSEELLDKDEPMEVYTQRIERMNIELPWFSALASLESELSDVLIKFENEGQLPPQIKFLETLHNKK